jgi:hypothetical protein
VSTAKRKRQKANRQAKRDAAIHVPEITDDDLSRLLGEVPTSVRTDCQHASTRTTDDGVVLIRCAVGAAVGGGCAADCERFEKRRVGGVGLGAGG